MRRLLLVCAVLAVASPAAAQPKGLDPTCLGPYQRYQAAPGPKAFAAGQTRGCGWQRQSSDAADANAIRAKAIAQCTANGGDGCRVVETGR